MNSDARTEIIVFGPGNGAGKTNILEAVSLLSPRTWPAGGQRISIMTRPARGAWLEKNHRNIFTA